MALLFVIHYFGLLAPNHLQEQPLPPPPRHHPPPPLLKIRSGHCSDSVQLHHRLGSSDGSRSTNSLGCPQPPLCLLPGMALLFVIHYFGLLAPNHLQEQPLPPPPRHHPPPPLLKIRSGHCSDSVQLHHRLGSSDGSRSTNSLGCPQPPLCLLPGMALLFVIHYFGLLAPNHLQEQPLPPPPRHHPPPPLLKIRSGHCSDSVQLHHRLGSSDGSRSTNSLGCPQPPLCLLPGGTFVITIWRTAKRSQIAAIASICEFRKIIQRECIGY
ncbi:carboxypeptidase Y-like [Beta vulgaris subsp. vulgaris]|uniref:carboxypeptidase Y-like n=1 Tax=Beta vulgaris subsp. vulgaris TaxID=3555 RepID=UPI002036A42A|nr:carboxypeptidase Y-like [Beta vulgaris subsp. vulgaris]